MPNPNKAAVRPGPSRVRIDARSFNTRGEAEAFASTKQSATTIVRITQKTIYFRYLPNGGSKRSFTVSVYAK